MTDGRERLYEMAEQTLVNLPVVQRLLEHGDAHDLDVLRSGARLLVDVIQHETAPTGAAIATEVGREMLAEFKPYPGMGDRFDQAVVPLRRTQAWRKRLGVPR